MNWLEFTESAASSTAVIDGAGADVRTFVPAGLMADVSVVLMTHNNVADIDPMVAGLRAEARFQSIKVVVADSGSTDGTLERLYSHPDVIVLSTGDSPGYVWSINEALRFEPQCHDVLVLKPSLRIFPGAIRILRRRMRVSGAGIVFPRLLDNDATEASSLREVGMARALGDATFGRRSSGRPEWLLHGDDGPEGYRFPQPRKCSSWAAALLSGNIVAGVANWDERPVLYSDESDYYRSVHGRGSSIWFEPSAIMQHSRINSGAAAA